MVRNRLIDSVRNLEYVYRLSNLESTIMALTRGSKLPTELGPTGDFPVHRRDEYSDGILGPGESVTVVFEVYLRDRKRFRRSVNVAEDRVKE